MVQSFEYYKVLYSYLFHSAETMNVRNAGRRSPRMSECYPPPNSYIETGLPASKKTRAAATTIRYLSLLFALWYWVFAHVPCKGRTRSSRAHRRRERSSSLLLSGALGSWAGFRMRRPTPRRRHASYSCRRSQALPQGARRGGPSTSGKRHTAPIKNTQRTGPVDTTVPYSE